jgi:hypothetical protein
MNNPYQILKLSQNANRQEIMKAQMEAMREKKHSLQEIGTAARYLLDPAKRLAADFMFPTRIKSKRPQRISLEVKESKLNTKDININAFDSLR